MSFILVKCLSSPSSEGSEDWNGLGLEVRVGSEDGD